MSFSTFLPNKNKNKSPLESSNRSVMKCSVISVGTEQQNTVKQMQLNDLVASDFTVCTATTV